MPACAPTHSRTARSKASTWTNRRLRPRSPRQLARSVGPQTVEETLQTIVETAQMSLPGFDHVGISTVERKGKITTRAATGLLVWELDTLQYTLDEGPCVDSVRGAEMVQAPSGSSTTADGSGTSRRRSTLACSRSWQFVCISTGRERVGGLNMYSTSSEQIDPNAIAMADLFATHDALALGKVRALDDLDQALRTRETIGKAIGLIMARYRLDEGAAFAFLARTSSHSNTKIRDVAAQMLEDHN